MSAHLNSRDVRVALQPGYGGGDDDGEEEDAYEAVAVNRVMMLCRSEERPRHPRHT